jgi:hypothetical protein
MARLVPDIDYVARLEKLRDSYITAYPRQRMSVIRLRLEHHHFGPNRLVTSVSAVEAYSRCLALRRRSRTKDDLRRLYRRYRAASPKTMIIEYLKVRGIDDPTAFFEEDNWKLFGYAEAYRNILVHECTYLGLDVFPSLIEACEAVLNKLEALVGAHAKRT